jgi:hypothetical protein
MKALTILLQSGRKAQIEPPSKAVSAEVGTLSILGSIGKWTIYEVAGSLEVVLIEAECVSLIKGVGKATLATMFETNLTPEIAVEQGLAKFVCSLPDHGFYILKNGKHVWTAEPETVEAQEKSIEDPF